MKTILQSITLLILGASMTTVADVFLKKSTIGSFWNFFVGAALYALVAIPVVLVFKINQFGIVILLWSAITVIIGLATGSVIFKEPITFLKFTALGSALLTIILSYLASK